MIPFYNFGGEHISCQVRCNDSTVFVIAIRISNAKLHLLS